MRHPAPGVKGHHALVIESQSNQCSDERIGASFALANPTTRRILRTPQVPTFDFDRLHRAHQQFLRVVARLSVFPTAVGRELTCAGIRLQAHRNRV